MFNGTTVVALLLLLALGLWNVWDFCQRSPRELDDDAVTDELEEYFRDKEA